MKPKTSPTTPPQQLPAPEVWLPIDGFEGLYEVSSHGRVKSLPRTVRSPKGTRTTRERILRPGNCRGRNLVVLCRETGKKTRLVARLVAEAFLKKPPTLPLVIHLDGNTRNDNLSNLLWSDYHTSNHRALARGSRVMPSGRDHWSAKARLVHSGS